MLSVIYSEIVTYNKPIMLSVIFLNVDILTVVMLNVVLPS